MLFNPSPTSVGSQPTSESLQKKARVAEKPSVELVHVTTGTSIVSEVTWQRLGWQIEHEAHNQTIAATELPSRIAQGNLRALVVRAWVVRARNRLNYPCLGSEFVSVVLCRLPA
jgi:hypothetical protein